MQRTTTSRKKSGETLTRQKPSEKCKEATRRHEHYGEDGSAPMIRVRGGTKARPWVVYISDDGSVCSRYVTPEPPSIPAHWYGRPGPCIHDERHR